MNKRVALKSGTSIHSGNGKGFDYIIKDVIGTGANCIVYSSTYTDNFGVAHKVIIKECYPYKSDIERVGDCLKWSSTEEEQDDKARFNQTYSKLATVSGNDDLVNETSKSIDCISYNNTIYSITVYDNAATFADTDYRSIIETLKTVRLLAYTVGKYHNSGLLHLDIKPDNFLVYPKPSEHIVLFDLDTITDINDISSGRIETVSCSEGWAAPEQMRGLVSKLCPATDIFSIGAVLFEKIMGRRVCYADTSIFAGWDYNDDRFNIRNVNPAIKRQLTNIFKKCLSANIKKRYQNTDDLIKDLDEAINLLAPGKPYIISEIEESINFVGREAELSEIDFAFSKGSKAVFLTGIGGIGKTEIAKSYAVIHKNDYDAVVYKRYNGSLKELLNDIALQNCICDKNDRNYESYVKDCLNEHILLVIDNFDVEYDEYLMRVLSLNCKILFTSRINRQEELNDSKYCFITINEMPRSDQMSVFIQNCQSPINQSDKGIIEKILDTINGYTLLIPLIAKQISKGLETLSELADKLKDAGIRGAAHGKVRHLKDGTQLAGNIYEILRKVLKIGETDEKEKYVICSLCLLNGIKINRKTFEKTIGREYSEAIDDLIFSGTVFCDTEKCLSLHMILNAVYKEEYQPHFTEFKWIITLVNTVFSQYYRNLRKLTKDVQRGEGPIISDRVLRMKANYSILYLIILNSVIGKEDLKYILNIIRKAFNKSRITAVECGCADINFIEKLAAKSAFQELSDHGKTVVYVLCYSIICIFFTSSRRNETMVCNQINGFFSDCFTRMTKYVELTQSLLKESDDERTIRRIQEIIDSTYELKFEHFSLEKYAEFYSQKARDEIETITSECNKLCAEYTKSILAFFDYVEFTKIKSSISAEYIERISDIKEQIPYFKCAVDFDYYDVYYEPFEINRFGNEADDVVDALLYFWEDIFEAESIDERQFKKEINTITHIELWEHYYDPLEEAEFNIEDLIRDGEDAYFDIKESMEEDIIEDYDISSYDLGSNDDDDETDSHISNLYYKDHEISANEELHESIWFEHIEAINNNYAFNPDKWEQGVVEFLRYGLTCMGFQCVETLDTQLIESHLGNAIIVKNTLIEMQPNDYEAVESCIVVDRFENAGIEEGRRLIDRYVEFANYNLTDVVLMEHIISDWNEKLSIYYSKLFIERLKKEDKTTKSVQILRKFAILIEDYDTLNQCDGFEDQLMVTPDSIIFETI